MKKFLLAIIIVLAITPWAVAAEQFKVGSVDFQRALNESEYGQKVKVELESIIRDRQRSIDERIQQRDKMRQDLEAQAAVLSEEAYRQRVEEVEKFERDLERQVADSNEELGKLQRKKEVEILRELDTVVAEIAKEGKYDLVLPVDVIVYSAEGLDITDQVIARYNERKKNEAEKPEESK